MPVSYLNSAKRLVEQIQTTLSLARTRLCAHPESRLGIKLSQHQTCHF